MIKQHPPAVVEPDGTLDIAFNAGTFTFARVLSSALQPDGKLLIGGQFAKVHGQPRLGLARLNSDGTLDSTFVPPAGVDLSARQIVVQADGKIIGVSSFDGSYVFRLNSDGSMDNGFAISIDGFYDIPGGIQISSPSVRTVLLQPDGKLIILGSFSSVKNASGTKVARSCIARLNSDGSLDESYQPANGGFAGGTTNTIPTVFGAVQQAIGANAGKIVAVGDFLEWGTVPVHGLLRINADGSRDSSFNYGNGSASPASELVGVSRQSDDSILVFGNFASFSGAPHNGIVRLDATSGAVDGGFNPPAFEDYRLSASILAIGQQSDGKLIAAGAFHFVGGVAAHNVVRLDTNGSRDTTFNSTAAGPNASSVETVLVRPSDNRILIGGFFSTYAGANRNNFAWVNSDGSADGTFAGLSGATDSGGEVYVTAVQPDGKILVGGLFSSMNGVPRYNLVRLNPDSSIDSSFNPNHGTEGSVRAILVQPDGKIVIGGNVEAVNGVARGRIARLNADGSLDTSFDPGSGANNTVYALSQDSAGNIYAGGAFTTFNGTQHRYIAKLSPTGTPDASFNPNFGTGGTIYAITPADASGRIVVAGSFTLTITGGTRREIARLSVPSGTVDTGFNAVNTGGFSGGPVRALQAAPDGSYYAAGLFSTYNNVIQRCVAKLTNDGALDPSFTSPFGSQFIPTLFSLAVQNGKVYLGGAPAGTTPPLVRLTNTGALDPSFNTGTNFQIAPAGSYWIPTPEIATLTFQPDGKLLVGGFFNQYNGTPRIALARITGPGDTPSPTPTATPTPIVTPTASPTPTATPTSTPTATPGGTATPTATPTASPTGTPIPGVVGNVSTRLPVGTGSDVLIEGFIVQGPAGSTKKILVRAIGPSLLPFGIPDALQNPALEIHDASGATIARNNDWHNTQIDGIITGDQSGEIGTSGVAPPNDLESAVIANLAAGNYTAVVLGVGDTKGTGVVDAYDLSATSPAKLANISTRGLVQPDDKLMIGGFIVQNGPVRLVVRAIGPSLSSFGISNALKDTTLQLRDKDGMLVLENDDWQTTQKQELEATGLQPTHPLEAAVVTTIQPGQYTAQVRGKDNASGIGVVQVYFLP